MAHNKNNITNALILDTIGQRTLKTTKFAHPTQNAKPEHDSGIFGFHRFADGSSS